MVDAVWTHLGDFDRQFWMGAFIAVELYLYLFVAVVFVCSALALFEQYVHSGMTSHKIEAVARPVTVSLFRYLCQRIEFIPRYGLCRYHTYFTLINFY